MNFLDKRFEPEQFAFAFQSGPTVKVETSSLSYNTTLHQIVYIKSNEANDFCSLDWRMRYRFTLQWLQIFVRQTREFSSW